FNQPICDSMGAAFTAKYPGIHVDGTKTTSEVAFQRVMQDLNGGAVQADVFTTTDASHLSYLISKGELVKYTPRTRPG
ncbi:MAG: Tat pathway signal protein, partial [Acetobacteraceae bacterium]